MSQALRAASANYAGRLLARWLHQDHLIEPAANHPIVLLKRLGDRSPWRTRPGSILEIRLRGAGD